MRPYGPGLRYHFRIEIVYQLRNPQKHGHKMVLAKYIFTKINITKNKGYGCMYTISNYSGTINKET